MRCQCGRPLGCPSPDRPYRLTPPGKVKIACDVCGGRGCDACRMTGELCLTECVNVYATADMPVLLNAAAVFGRGVMPVVGGFLDQSSVGVEAMKYAGEVLETLHGKA